MKNNKFINWIKNPSSDIWLFVILVVLINLVAARVICRLDITNQKAFSLSKASKEVVKTLEEPLSVKVFFSNKLRAPYSTVEQYLKDLLVEYKNASSSNFSYEYFNMDKPENEKLARDFNLNQVQIREFKNNEVGVKNVYMGLAITYADQVEVIDGITTSSNLEYKLTTAFGKIVSNANVLAGLSNKVKVTLYKTDELKKFKLANFDSIDSKVETAFNAANKKFQDKLTFEKYSPSSEEAVELSEKYGIQALNWKNSDGTVSAGALGLVLEYGDKFSLVPLQAQNMIFQYVILGLDELEENFTSAVEALVSKTSKVAYITGHGELDINDAQKGAANFSELCDDIYSFEEVNLAEKNIPFGVQSAIINGPKTAFTEAELYKLDQFLMKGGNLIFFVDSYNEIMPEQQSYYQQMPPRYEQIDNGLEKLFEKWGIVLEDGYVCDKDCYTQNHPQYGKLNFYFIPIVDKNCLNQKNPLTKNLGMLLMYQASSLDISQAKENKTFTTIPLVSSSKDSWLLQENINLSPLTIYPPAEKEQFGSKTLSVLLEGKFESAFDSNPSVTDADDADSLLTSKVHLAKSTQAGKVFVASSSGITGPQIIGGKENAGEPIAIFVRNVVDYMNGNKDFCTMRTKNLDLNVLDETSGPLVEIAKYFNEFGIAIIVAVIGLVVFLLRRKRREQIRLNYDPEDSRIEK